MLRLSCKDVTLSVCHKKSLKDHTRGLIKEYREISAEELRGEGKKKP